MRAMPDTIEELLPEPDAPGIPGKPGRSFTRSLTVGNNILAWAAIGASIWLGREMASIIAPLMVALIASLLGIYQSIGHFDLRTLTQVGIRRKRKPAVKPDDDAAP